MPSNQHILNELNEISQTVANLPDLPVFTVPENYFAEFPEKLMSIIREDAKDETNLISPLLGGIKRTTPFSVPEGYFSSLERNLTKLVAAESEHLSVSPMALSESKGSATKPETVVLPKSVSVEATGENVSGRVISISPARQVYRFAMAAAVAGIIGLSAWFYVHQEEEKPVAQVNINAELPKVSEKEMSEFLLTAPDMPQAETLQLAGLENLDIEEMLKDVNENELKEYVKDEQVLMPEKMN